MTKSVINNTEKCRFELMVDGQVALIDYRVESQPKDNHKVYVFVHTEVPSALGGKGIGARLTAGALEHVRVEGAKMRSECSFISAYLGKHPEYKDTLAH